MQPTPSVLSMYGATTDLPALEWSWADDQLAAAGSYWVTVGGSGMPHPRPVWGVWAESTLWLSVGSTHLNEALQDQAAVGVHLSSDTDVVLVEGRSVGSSHRPDLIDAYNRKYDWDYVVAHYGPLQVVEVDKVMAWQSGGWAGREGFVAAGRWRFER